jgi:chemotaxis protein MotB
MSAHKGKKRRGHDDHEEHADERWLLTYADMITLLMALFVVMWSMANVNTSKYEALSKSLKDAFSGKILPGGEAPLQPGKPSPQNAPEAPIPAIQPVTKDGQGDGTRSDAPRKETEDLEKLQRDIDQYVKDHGLEREVETDIARRGLVVRVLTDKVLFESGSAEVKKQADPLLDALSRLLKATVRNPIQVEGNTDNVPVAAGSRPTGSCRRPGPPPSCAI